MIDTIKRNLTWIIIAVSGIVFLNIYYGKFFWEFMATLLMISIAEAMALSLSNVAIYVYTKIDFTSQIIYGVDKKLNSIEQHAFAQTIGYIFMGVHFLVGIGLVGIYIANFK